MAFKAAVASLLTLAAVQAATISIQPSSASAVVSGAPVSLNVEVFNVTDLFAFQFDIGFDPTVVSAVSVSEGSFLPSGGTTAFVAGTIDNTAGTISATADSLIGAVPGVSGAGVLASLRFAANAPGTSPVTLSNIILLDSNLNSIEFTSANGSIRAVQLPEPGPAFMLVSGLLILFALQFRRSRKA